VPNLHCEHGVSVLCQLLITKACSVTEFGSGAMVRAPWEALDKRLKVLVSRDQPGGVPAELLPGAVSHVFRCSCAKAHAAGQEGMMCSTFTIQIQNIHKVGKYLEACACMSVYT
jgi:hypothetical protein